MKKVKSFLVVLGICTTFGALNVSANTEWHYSPYMVAQAYANSGLRSAVEADTSHFTQCQIKRLRKSDGAMVFVNGDSACGTTSIEDNSSFDGQKYTGYAQALYYADISPYSGVIYDVYANSDKTESDE